MCTLTEYKKPKLLYPAPMHFIPIHKWELVDGIWKRLYRRSGIFRRALIRREAGGWKWEVIELGKRGRRTVVGRGYKVYFSPHAAMPFAELSVMTQR